MTTLVGLSADLRGTLALSDATQANVHPMVLELGQTRSRYEWDLSTSPRAAIDLSGRRSSFSIGYNPRLTLSDLGREDEELNVLHTAFAAYSYRWRHSAFRLSETATYGTQDFATLGYLAPSTPSAPATTQPGTAQPGTTQPGPTLMPMPPQQSVGIVPGGVPTLRVFSQSTTAWIGTELGHRTTAGFSLSEGIFGGLGETSQLIYPQQRSQTAAPYLGYALSHRDALTMGASVSHTEVDPPGSQHWLVLEGVTWTRTLTPKLTSSVGIGAAHAWTRTETGWVVNNSPTGSATLNGAIYSYAKRRFSISVTFGLLFAPIVNPIVGNIQETLGASTGVVVRKDRTTIAGTLSTAQTFPIDEATAVRFLGVNVVATHQLGSLVSVFAGYSTALQVSSSAQQSFPRMWNAYAGITLAAPPMRF